MHLGVGAPESFRKTVQSDDAQARRGVHNFLLLLIWAKGATDVGELKVAGQHWSGRRMGRIAVNSTLKWLMNSELPRQPGEVRNNRLEAVDTVSGWDQLRSP